MTTQLKDFSKFIGAAGVLGLVSLGMTSTANAAIIQIGAGAFSSPTGSISFSEQAVGTINPVYVGAAGVPTVSFGATFTSPLTLSGNTSIVTDTDNATSPVLSGDPKFNGPISVLFSSNVSSVGIDAGFFDNIGSTQLTAFDRNGLAIGSVLNATAGGIEFLGLGSDDGTNQIAGLQVSVTGNEPFGFAIDNLRFNAAASTTAVPEPFTIVGTLIGGTAALRIRKKLKSNDKV